MLEVFQADFLPLKSISSAILPCAKDCGASLLSAAWQLSHGSGSAAGRIVVRWEPMVFTLLCTYMEVAKRRPASRFRGCGAILWAGEAGVT